MLFVGILRFHKIFPIFCLPLSFLSNSIYTSSYSIPLSPTLPLPLSHLYSHLNLAWSHVRVIHKPLKRSSPICLPNHISVGEYLAHPAEEMWYAFDNILLEWQIFVAIREKKDMGKLSKIKKERGDEKENMERGWQAEMEASVKCWHVMTLQRAAGKAKQLCRV